MGQGPGDPMLTTCPILFTNPVTASFSLLSQNINYTYLTLLIINDAWIRTLALGLQRSIHRLVVIYLIHGLILNIILPLVLLRKCIKFTEKMPNCDYQWRWQIDGLDLKLTPPAPTSLPYITGISSFIQWTYEITICKKFYAFIRFFSYFQIDSMR